MRNSLGHIRQVVKCFLNEFWDQKSPLLIGYSGGPDSKALLYATLDWGKAPLHIAHVDHAWRKESHEEAESLRLEASRLGVPFHVTRLTHQTNEEEARECRLAYYRTLQEQLGCQAVLLGHQADDLAETVLKRLFEGAHLLHGMRPITEINGVRIWRPLLKVSRHHIEEFLQFHKLHALRDPTNHDPKYLRARMRSELIPWLNESFGKNISQNLARLSDRYNEWGDYLNFRVQHLKNRMVAGPFGWWIDGEGLPRMELRWLIQYVAERELFVFSDSLLESILDAMMQKAANHKASMAHRQIVIDRGHFFLLAKKLPQFEGSIQLPIAGLKKMGDWSVEMTNEPISCRWQDLWQRGWAIQSFQDGAELVMPRQTCSKGKIPAFFRNICPIISDHSGNWDFLSAINGKGKGLVKIFIDPELVSNQ